MADSPAPRSSRALLALLAGATAIGVAPIWIRLSESGPLATAFYRLFFALPFFWSWLWYRSYARPAPSLTSRQLGHLFGAGLFFALDMAFWCLSVHLTTVANATLLTNTAPLFVTLGAWAWFQEPIDRRFLKGLAIAFIGMIILSGASVSTLPQQLAGDGLALLAAVFYGGYMLYLKTLRRHIDSAQLMAWSGLTSSLALGLIAWFSGESLTIDSSRGLIILIALAVTGQVAGQTLIAYAFKHLPASFSAVGLLWQPAVASLLAWFILKENISTIQIAGGLVIIGGIYSCRKADV